MQSPFQTESLSTFSSSLKRAFSAMEARLKTNRPELSSGPQASHWPKRHRPLHSTLSPRLSYGRHRGPARENSRRAAVIIAVYPHRKTGELCLTLTRRPTTLSHHGGQICLPGGRIESGESPLDAALREYQEELGLAIDLVTVAGRLSPIYVYASDNLVETLVVTSNSPSRDWNPDPVEVDEVIEMPLASLSCLSNRETLFAAGRPETAGQHHDVSEGIVEKRAKRRQGRTLCGGDDFEFSYGYRALKFTDCNTRQCELWGATAILLDEFAAVIARLSS